MSTTSQSLEFQRDFNNKLYVTYGPYNGQVHVSTSIIKNYATLYVSHIDWETPPPDAEAIESHIDSSINTIWHTTPLLLNVR